MVEVNNNFNLLFEANFFATKKGRLRPTEGTFPDRGRFNVKYSEDYGYQDTTKRFRDISKFGKGFRGQRRFRESGDILY